MKLTHKLKPNEWYNPETGYIEIITKDTDNSFRELEKGQLYGSDTCGCVWASGKRPFSACCGLSDEQGDWFCTKPKRHDGDHVACTPGKHNVHKWSAVVLDT